MALKGVGGSLTQCIPGIAGTSGITQMEAPTLGTLCVCVHVGEKLQIIKRRACVGATLCVCGE